MLLNGAMNGMRGTRSEGLREAMEGAEGPGKLRR